MLAVEKQTFHPKAHVSPKPITKSPGSLKRSKYKLDAVANCNSFTQEAKASDSITAQSRGLAELDVPRPFLKEKKTSLRLPQRSPGRTRKVKYTSGTRGIAGMDHKERIRKPHMGHSRRLEAIERDVLRNPRRHGIYS